MGHRDPEVLRELIVGRELYTADVADELDVSERTVRKYQKKHDIPLPHRNPDVLRKLYVGRDLDKVEVAEELDVDRNTVARWLDKHGIRKPYHDPEVLRRVYWEEGKTISEVADDFGVSSPTILRQMKKRGIERRTAPQDRPPYFCHADGGGYELVQTRVDGDLKTIGIHRLVAIAEYGYDAVSGNDTHHLNGVPWDNRPSNVITKSHGDHTSGHAVERDDRNPDGTWG